MECKGKRDRLMVRCSDCDSIYTAWVWESGAIRLGGSSSCPCGSPDLVIIDEFANQAADLIPAKRR